MLLRYDEWSGQLIASKEENAVALHISNESRVPFLQSAGGKQHLHIARGIQVTIVSQTEGVRKCVTMINGNMRIVSIKDRQQIDVAGMWHL